MIVAALPLLALRVDVAVARRCRSDAGPGKPGIVLSAGVDAEADKSDDEGSGDERAVWNASVKSEDDGVRYIELVVLIEDMLLNLFVDLGCDRGRSGDDELCLTSSTGEMRGLMSMVGDLSTCIGYDMEGLIEVLEGGGSGEGISSAKNR